MYLHLGQDTVVREKEIIGIFDLDNSTVSANTRRFLAAAEKGGQVVNVTADLPKTFVLTTAPGHRAREKETTKIYICQLSTNTLKKRTGGRQT